MKSRCGLCGSSVWSGLGREFKTNPINSCPPSTTKNHEEKMSHAKPPSRKDSRVLCALASLRETSVWAYRFRCVAAPSREIRSSFLFFVALGGPSWATSDHRVRASNLRGRVPSHRLPHLRTKPTNRRLTKPRRTVAPCDTPRSFARRWRLPALSRSRPVRLFASPDLRCISSFLLLSILRRIGEGLGVLWRGFGGAFLSLQEFCK